MIALKSGGDIRHANMIYKVAQGIIRMCLIFFSMRYCTYNCPHTTFSQISLVTKDLPDFLEIDF